MPELIESPEIAEEDLLINDLTKKVFSNFANRPTNSRSYHPAEIQKYIEEHPELNSEQIIDEVTNTYLHTKSYSSGQVEQREPREAALHLIQELLKILEDVDEVVGTKDFALLHECFETLAKTTDVFQDKEPKTVSFINQLIDRYVQATREFILKDPSGGDLLTADTEDSRNAFRVYLAVESSISGDFDTARGMLVDVDEEVEEPLETALLARLEEAELESKLARQKITPETSIENLQKLGLHASDQAIQEVEQSDPRITVGTTIETLDEILSPGGRYMTAHELNIKSSGNDLSSRTSQQRGRGDPFYNELRLRAEHTLGHSSNPFLPKMIYGAFTSDLQTDRGSGYGRVTLYLKSEATHDPDTTFTYGDSLDQSHGAEARQLSAADALIAYASRIEQKASLARGSYIEAQFRGLALEKLEKVSIVMPPPGEGFGSNAEVIDTSVENDIKTEVVIDTGANAWSIQDRVKRRIESGMTEEQAVAETVSRIRSNFKSADSPLFSLVFSIPEESDEQREKRQSHFAYAGELNVDLFARYGVTIKRPKLGKLLEGKKY